MPPGEDCADGLHRQQATTKTAALVQEGRLKLEQFGTVGEPAAGEQWQASSTNHRAYKPVEEHYVNAAYSTTMPPFPTRCSSSNMCGQPWHSLALQNKGTLSTKGHSR